MRAKKTVKIENVEVKPIKERKSYFSEMQKISFGKMSNKDQTFFIKRLSFLVKAGVPVLDSLHMIKEQTRKKGYVRILDAIILDVSNGQQLSTSLAKYPNMFSDFSINIISFG